MDWETMGLNFLPEGYDLDDFHHLNTSFPFVISSRPSPFKNPLSNMFNRYDNNEPPTGHNETKVLRGSNFNALTQPDPNPLKKHFMKNDCIQQPKDENWESIQSVTETSVTSSFKSLTDSTEDERTISQMHSSDFVSMGDTYSASEESTDIDTFESDATFDSQVDTEASEMTDYGNTKNELSKHSSKKTGKVIDSGKSPENKISSKKSKKLDNSWLVEENPQDHVIDEHLPYKNKKSHKRAVVTSKTINGIEYFTNDPSLFKKLKFPPGPKKHKQL